MPVVKFFGRLDLDQIFLFVDRHYIYSIDIRILVRLNPGGTRTNRDKGDEWKFMKSSKGNGFEYVYYC